MDQRQERLGRGCAGDYADCHGAMVARERGEIRDGLVVRAAVGLVAERRAARHA